MKKFVTLLLVALMVVAMATTAYAAKVGEEVTVQFTTSNNPGFGSFNAVINYDATVLELVKVEAGSVVAGGTFISNGNQVGFMSVTDATGNGTLFTATFKIKDAAVMGKTYNVSASLVPGSAMNGNYDTVTFSINGGSVTIDPCTHSWNAGTVTKEATCTENGVKTYTCTVAGCGDTKTEVIPATGHTFGSWKVTTEATCTDKGVETRECACGEKETREIAAKGHALNTYGKDEDQHWQLCDNCDYVGDKEDHSYDYNGVCACGATKPVEEDPDLDDVPATGDITPYIVMTFVSVLVLVVAVSAAFVLKRKTAK